MLCAVPTARGGTQASLMPGDKALHQAGGPNWTQRQQAPAGDRHIVDSEQDHMRSDSFKCAHGFSCSLV